MSGLAWPLLMLAAAIVLLVFEVFIPSGGVLGTLSGIMFVAAVVAGFYFGGMVVGTWFMAGTAVLIPGLVYLAITWWPRTPLGKRILIEPPQGDEWIASRRRDGQQWVGQHGIAVTALLPAGAIKVGKTTLDVISDGVSIEKGTPVEIVAIRGTSLVVRPRDRSNSDKDSKNAATNPTDQVIPDPFDDSLP